MGLGTGNQEIYHSPSEAPGTETEGLPHPCRAAESTADTECLLSLAIVWVSTGGTSKP